MADELVTVYFNPSCSKCRGARALLEERGVSATYVHYLDERPTRQTLEALLERLGETSPRAIVRTGEPIYEALKLADADDERLFSAIVAHPILLERPIVVRGDRAVMARPPERIGSLFQDSDS